MLTRDATRDRMAFEPAFTITNQIAAGLTRIERARGFLDASTLSASWMREMARRAFVLEAHHTTHIEGTRLTIAQSEALLAGGDVPGSDPDDTRELLNYRTAFDFVASYVADGGPVTEGVIREIHKRLVAGVRGGSAGPGQYRQVQNLVVNSATGETVYTPPAAYDVPWLMAELARWLGNTGDVHPVIVSGVAQFQLVHIHPFLDGNGRTSRLLSTLCLYQAGYDFKRLFTISEFYDRDRTAFYGAIRSVRANGMNMTNWLEYFVLGLATQLTEVKALGEQAIRCDMLARQYGLSDRQAEALRLVMERGSLTIQDFESLRSGVNRRSLQRDIRVLVDKGLLASSGATNTLVYHLRIAD